MYTDCRGLLPYAILFLRRLPVIGHVLNMPGIRGVSVKPILPIYALCAFSAMCYILYYLVLWCRWPTAYKMTLNPMYDRMPN